MIKSRTRKNGWQLVAFPVGGMALGTFCCFAALLAISTVIRYRIEHRISSGLPLNAAENQLFTLVVGSTCIVPLIIGALLFLGGYYLALYNNRPSPNTTVIENVMQSITSEQDTPH